MANALQGYAGLIEALSVAETLWHVGDVVRKLRTDRGWTGARLAKKANVDKSVIRRITIHYKRHRDKNIPVTVPTPAPNP